MNVISNDAVVSTAAAISRYLESRPNASETIDGVAKWWLLRQRYEDSKELVEMALNYLEARGTVEKTVVAGGKVMYRKSDLNINSMNN